MVLVTVLRVIYGAWELFYTSCMNEKIFLSSSLSYINCIHTNHSFLCYLYLFVWVVERLCGYPPFNDSSTSNIYEQITSGKFAFPEKDWATISAEGFNTFLLSQHNVNSIY